MNTRKEKIKFLKGLLKGENQIFDLIPQKFERFINDDEEPDRYYRSGMRTGERVEYFTLDQFNEYKKKHPRRSIMTIKICRKGFTNDNEKNTNDISLDFGRPGQDETTIQS